MNKLDAHAGPLLTGMQIGEVLTGDWFVPDLTSRINFWNGTYLSSEYGEFDDSYLPGFMLLALLDPLMNKLLPIQVKSQDGLNYGLDRVRFPSMAKPEEPLRLKVTIAALEGKPSGVLMHLDCVLEAQYGPPRLVARWLVLKPSPTT